MKVTDVGFMNTKVANLSPLRGMILGKLDCQGAEVADLSPLYECNQLNSLIVKNTKVTPAAVAALQKALPNCKIQWDDPSKGPSPQLSSLSGEEPGVKGIPSEALTFVGHRYLLVESPGTWHEAKAKAEVLGGHLAAITSKEERLGHGECLARNARIVREAMRVLWEAQRAMEKRGAGLPANRWT